MYQYRVTARDGVSPYGRVDWLQCIGWFIEGRATKELMVMADPGRPRHYEEEFKRRIVQLYENGKPAREIRTECDISRSTLHRWVRGSATAVRPGRPTTGRRSGTS